MTTPNPESALNAEALEKARVAFVHVTGLKMNTRTSLGEAIRAYLAALPPSAQGEDAAFNTKADMLLDKALDAARAALFDASATATQYDAVKKAIHSVRSLCTHCWGDGADDPDTGSKCPRCNGVGHFKLKRVPASDEGAG